MTREELDELERKYRPSIEREDARRVGAEQMGCVDWSTSVSIDPRDLDALLAAARELEEMKVLVGRLATLLEYTEWDHDENTSSNSCRHCGATARNCQLPEHKSNCEFAKLMSQAEAIQS